MTLAELKKSIAELRIAVSAEAAQQALSMPANGYNTRSDRWALYQVFRMAELHLVTMQDALTNVKD